MVFGVSQAGFTLPALNLVGPEDGHITIENFTPALKWSRTYTDANSSESQTPDSFKVIIYTLSPSNVNQPDYNIIHEEEKIKSSCYKVPTSILESETTYHWEITAYKGDQPVAKSERRSFITENICIVGDENNNDWDCDGIPDEAEEFIGTNPQKKTLFIRPKKQQSHTSPEWVYWNKFIELFPAKPRNCFGGFADIPQLTEAGIEIVVIGAKCHKYSKFDNFSYDPSLSDDTLPDDIMIPDGKLPCNILEIEYYDEKGDCRENCELEFELELEKKDCKKNCKSPYNVEYKGHTNLLEIKTYNLGEYETNYIWAWDQKGYAHGDKNLQQYPTIRLFKFPLDNYFEEGAYKCIKSGQIPSITGSVTCELPITKIHCNLSNIDCGKIGPGNLVNIDCNFMSSVNLMSPENQELFFNLVFTEAPDHTLESDTVEFTPIVYNNDPENGMSCKKGQIKYVPSKIFSCMEGLEIVWDADSKTERMKPYKYIDDTYKTVKVRPYTKDDVLRRTIVHEIGHALMVGDNSDHCFNPKCIMYSYTTDWEPRSFGPPCGLDENGDPFYCCDHRPKGGRDIRALGAVYNTPH